LHSDYASNSGSSDKRTQKLQIQKHQVLCELISEQPRALLRAMRQLGGSYAWKDMLRDLIRYPFLFLSEYFRRKHSESAFSAVKQRDNWKIWQKRENRKETIEQKLRNL